MDDSSRIHHVSLRFLLIASFISALLLQWLELSYLILDEHRIRITIADDWSTFFFTVLLCVAVVVIVRIITTHRKKTFPYASSLLLGCAMLASVINGQAQETQYSKAAIAAYGDTFGKYLATIISLDLLSSGQCSYAFNEPYNFSAAVDEGLSAFPADLRSTLHQTFLVEMKDQLREFATKAQKDIFLAVTETTDVKTACGMQVGMAARNLVHTKDLLRQVRNPYFQYNPVFQ